MGTDRQRWLQTERGGYRQRELATDRERRLQTERAGYRQTEVATDRERWLQTERGWTDRGGGCGYRQREVGTAEIGGYRQRELQATDRERSATDRGIRWLQTERDSYRQRFGYRQREVLITDRECVTLQTERALYTPGYSQTEPGYRQREVTDRRGGYRQREVQREVATDTELGYRQREVRQRVEAASGQKHIF